MKIRITSFFLATVIALSMSGCSLKKDTAGSSQSIVTETTMDGELQNDLQTRMISFIENISSSGLDIDLTNFFNKVKTLSIYTDSSNKEYYNSYYDKELNQIFYNIDTPGALEHELVHVIYNNDKELGNVFLEEGFTELLASEVCDSDNTYRYNVGITKILCTILGRDKVFKTMNDKDLSIITNGLSDIVPAVKDAEEYMSYSNYEHSLVQKMHQAYYEGKLDEFKKTKEYIELVNVRKDLTSRIKIYVKNYYMKLVRQEGIDAKQVLTEMLAILDIVDVELFDPDIEKERANDFFLRDEVDYIMQTYGLSDDDYDACYQASKVREFLFVDSSAVSKNEEIKK